MGVFERDKLRRITPLLLFSCFCLLSGDALFGYDTGSFGGILANPGFINEFGQKNAKGALAISATRSSLVSSLPFIGKFIGCVGAGPLIEWIGHRYVFVILAVVSVIGIIVEITSAGTGQTSGRLAQFIVGRIIVYASIGLVEVNVTVYQSEIVPASFRGFVVVSLQLFLNAGSLMATGINKRYSTRTDSSGWKTVTGIQFIFPILICAFVPFIPDSPRWLLSKDRWDDAVTSMRRLRPKSESADGTCELEVQSIKEALQAQVHKAPWTNLVKGTNFRRTMLVLGSYTFQQITGQAFVSTYQTTFYKTNGYAAQAFLYPVINALLSFFAVLPGMFLVDTLGRRGILMLSCGGQAFWLFMLAGLGSKKVKNTSIRNTVVAAFMMNSITYNMGNASVPYALGAELPNSALREKTDAIGTGLNVVWAFVTNFVIPYMLAALAFKVGYIFGGISVLAVIFYFIFLPETKGRALEEIDAIFEQPFNPFKQRQLYESAAAQTLHRLERHGAVNNEPREEEEKHVGLHSK